jgi:dihydrofolate reductase
MLQITLIAAMDRARAIGRGNAMPWHLSDDLKRFKALTLGKPIVMGRKTFESIGRPLPKRRNIILTRDPSFHAEGVEVIHSLEAGLADLECFDLEAEVMITGGGEVYSLALPIAHKMHLTFVDTLVENADAFFPPWNPAEWHEVSREVHEVDDRHALGFSFVDLERAHLNRTLLSTNSKLVKRGSG